MRRLLIVLTLFIFCLKAGAAKVTTYIVPAITNTYFLPADGMASSYAGMAISMRACAGEIESASFVVRANENVTGLNVSASDLTGIAGTISSDSINIRVVKCWWVAGNTWHGIGAKTLAPELLLKDDSFINVDSANNYIKETNGTYYWINNGTTHFPTNLTVTDASTLQPVNIPANTNKQFWVNIKIPKTALPGTYSGTITLSQSSGQIQLTLAVLPFALEEYPGITSVYHIAQNMGDTPQITYDDFNKSWTQYRAEIKDMVEHGIKYPITYITSGSATMATALTIWREEGLPMDNYLFLALGFNVGNPQDSAGLASLRNRVKSALAFYKGYGFKNIFFYGIDELQVGDPQLLSQVQAWDAVRQEGGNMYVAMNNVQYQTGADNPVGTYFNQTTGAYKLGNLLDVANYSCARFGANRLPLSYFANESAFWHSVGHKIVEYEDPQAGVEQPDMYRRNYGLWIWQANFDGVMDFAYQYFDAWNDWANSVFKMENFTHPTSNGVVGTTGWEGFREGINDMRYMTTLQKIITQAKARSVNTSAADTWLAGLKTAALATQDMYSVRKQMIDYCLQYSSATAIANPLKVSPNHVGAAMDGRVLLSNIPNRSNVSIYTLTGRLLKFTKVSGNNREWDLMTDGGKRVRNGMYFYVINEPATGAREIGKIILK